MAEKGKGYTIGVSSGMFKIAQGKEREDYLTFLNKVFWGSTKGVDFTQLDLESITEFKEPFLKKEVERIKSLGLRFGIHGESAATTGIHTIPLDSALTDDYKRAHTRLMEHIIGGGETHAEYVLVHASESTPMILLGKEFQPTKLVDFWGRPIKELIEDPSVKKKMEEWLLKADYVWEFTHNTPDEYISDYKERVSRATAAQRSEGNEEQPKKEDDAKIEEAAKKNALEVFFKKTNMSDLVYGAERAAYYVVAKWMELTKDPLWENIAGGKKIDSIYKEFEKWVPAVSAKYIWGHFNPIRGGDYESEDPKKKLDQYNLDWVFETEMAQGGYETYMRLAEIPHLYYLAAAIGSKHVGVAVDAEHLLSANLNPLEQVAKLPNRGGELVKVIHAGFPTPHIPGHIPIAVGSEAQRYIYRMLFILRQKGFKNGIIIFERGGGEDPVRQTVLALRLIVQFLEKDVEPDKLPEEFYGMKPGGPEIARQLVTIREHALDPMKGLITVPEEEHGFFGKAAIEKGKGEEWKKEKYK